MKLYDPHFWHLLSRIDGHFKKIFENRFIGTTSIATFPLGNLLKAVRPNFLKNGAKFSQWFLMAKMLNCII